MTESGWSAGVATVSNDAGKNIDNMIQDRSPQRASEGASVSSEYSLVGMDMTKAGAAYNAITDYVNAIVNHLEDIDELATADNAYRSEDVQLAVQEYVKNVKKYCMNLCSQLEGFNDKLQEALNAWTKASLSMAETIRSSASGLAAGTRYGPGSNYGSGDSQ